jgi:ankyrin repeat protein
VEYGADINRVFQGSTLLLAAIESCDFDTVRLALSLGADPNLKCPVLAAFFTGRHDIMTLLVENGADIDYVYGDGTILGMAMTDEVLEEVRFLLSLGADPNVGDPMWDMLESCVVQRCNDCVHEDIAILLMERDATHLTQFRYRGTLLHYAAGGAHTRLLRAAMDRITSQLVLDCQNALGNTALHCAAGTLGKVPLQQTLEVVSILLEAGADINARNAQGATALKIAAEEGSDGLVQLLLEAGATIGIENKGSVCWQTALSSAAYRGHSTIVGLLLEKTPPHSDSPFLERALRNAVRKQHAGIVKQLLLFGAGRFAEEVLGLALDESSAEVVQILLDAGARVDNVEAYFLSSLFDAGTEDAREDCDGFFEARLKRELLIRAFPDRRNITCR